MPPDTDLRDDLFVAARECMVNSQVRPNKVSDPRILSAMRRLPRAQFLPARLRHLAYLDEDVPLGNGRSMLEPMVLARLLQSALLKENETVLTVGAGTGYTAAVLDACGCRVTALEEDAALLALARTVLAAQAPGVTLAEGSLAAGWPLAAPYDVILIEGAVSDVPPALAAQLRPAAGRLLCAMCAEGSTTRAVMGEATAAGLRMYPLFDCGTPAIPTLRRALGFEF